MKSESMKKRVVITGYGLVTPLGNNADTVWRRICNGESGITLLVDEERSIFRSKIGGQCSDFTMDSYIPVKDSRKIERFAQFALTSAIDAVQLSGLDFNNEDVCRCAVVIGCGVGGLAEIERQDEKLAAHGPSRISPFTIPKIMLNAASSHVSIYYGIHGPTYGVATACASANNAMIDSFRMIRDGDVDFAITGGTEAALSKLGLAGFSAMHALSERNDAPAKASRPYDRDRDGFVLSEGAGILIFEELEHAKKRRAQIYAEVIGYGISSDACHITQPDKDGFSAAVAMSSTIRSAGLVPEQIDYINAHGTATLLGDVAETAAIKQAMGEAAYKVSISSTKSSLGHLLGGSGGVELIMSLLSIRDNVVHPTINLENPDPACDLDFTPLVARERHIDYVISNSFGFGGHNACIAICRFFD